MSYESKKGSDFLIFTVELSVTVLRFADLLRPSQLLTLSGESFCLLNFVPLEGICFFTFGYLLLCECRGDPGSSCTCGERRRLLSAPGSNSGCWVWWQHFHLLGFSFWFLFWDQVSLTVQSRLAWNVLCRSNWPLPCNDPPAVFLSAGILGMHLHH